MDRNPDIGLINHTRDSLIIIPDFALRIAREGFVVCAK